jgi:hypothetical protein
LKANASTNQSGVELNNEISVGMSQRELSGPEQMRALICKHAGHSSSWPEQNIVQI